MERVEIEKAFRLGQLQVALIRADFLDNVAADDVEAHFLLVVGRVGQVAEDVVQKTHSVDEVFLRLAPIVRACNRLLLDAVGATIVQESITEGGVVEVSFPIKAQKGSAFSHKQLGREARLGRRVSGQTTVFFGVTATRLVGETELIVAA